MSRGGTRGRGSRGGRGGMSFNIEALGFGRGEPLLPPTLQPPPKYPPLRQQPLPLVEGDEVNYLLELSKDFAQTMQSSPYFIRPEEDKFDVERYSDKYRTSRNSDSTIDWTPDWRRLPKELQIATRKKKKMSPPGSSVKPNLVKKKETDFVEMGKKLDELEKLDKENKDDDKDEEEGGSGAEEDEEAPEEEQEEENDYLSSYFDNGENYLDEEEDNLDEKDGGIY